MVRRVSSGADMAVYARSQASQRLARFAFEFRRAAGSRDAEAVHDLRVAIRRLSECLKIFGPFFAPRESRKIRRKLRKIMDRAAGVRDRDVGIALLREAGLSGKSRIAGLLAAERRRAEAKLVSMLKRWNRREYSAKWRTRLGL